MIDLSGSEWKEALSAGFDANTHEFTKNNTTITIFKFYGVKIAYVNFIVGLKNPTNSILEEIDSFARTMKIDIVRHQTTEKLSSGCSIFQYHQTTAIINDLQNWDEKTIEKPRRTAKKLKTNTLNIRKATTDDSATIFDIYTETIQRNSATKKYNATYFQKTAPSAWVACENSRIIAFVLTGRHHSRGLYLHGGHRANARNSYASDKLFLTMLREAKSNNLQTFDFLTSPPSQPSLLRYKLAWGGTQECVIISDHPITIKGYLFATLYYIQNRLNGLRITINKSLKKV